MKHDAAYWYRRYVAYMQSLAADTPEPPESVLPEKPTRLHTRKLTLDEFQAMWMLIQLDRELTRRWIRRLTDGYEKEKAKVLALLDVALSAVPLATESNESRPKDSAAA